MKSGKRRVVLHIGWPKTGTTTLQKHVFPKFDEYRYLGNFPSDFAKSHCTTEMTHLLAFASVEKIDQLQRSLWVALQAKEAELFGNVDMNIPLILSEEAILSSLLRVSDHQHHGYCTASLEQILQRLLFLEERWNITFDFLLCERDPIEILHSFYAQGFHLYRRVPSLDSFLKYVAAGLTEHPMHDLGFAYLKPGYVIERLHHHMGKDRVFSIHMTSLFTANTIRMASWYPGFPDVPASETRVENRRTLSADTKLSHFRPKWIKKKRFQLLPFLRKVKWMYMVEHADHGQLEVPIILQDKERQALAFFLFGTDAKRTDHLEHAGMKFEEHSNSLLEDE